MQHKSEVINRMALVLICLVVLELVLIGDQVAPIKAIKKKIFLKKLKKLLPLLALAKHKKKKIILIPIPMPMFNKPMMDMPMQSFDIPMDSYGGGGGGGGGGGDSYGGGGMSSGAGGGGSM